MLRDITLGQYYQTESVIHKLDPRVKLGGTIIYIISLVLFENIWAYLLAALFLGFVIKLSNVPFKYMVRGMKAILFLLLITVGFNLFLTASQQHFSSNGFLVHNLFMIAFWLSDMLMLSMLSCV